VILTAIGSLRWKVVFSSSSPCFVNSVFVSGAK
jgi:hypothetical protein